MSEIIIRNSKDKNQADYNYYISRIGKDGMSLLSV